MKPLLLEISGLGSFENLQSVDFENLTTSGLFGIFGKTGAGKSTILDSLTLALYNNIDRYPKEKAEMINLNRKDCFVNLVFSIKDKGVDIVYKVERSYRLDPHGKIVNKKHILSRKITGVEEFEPIVEGVKEVNSKMEELISLTYEDFTKAVILPQGKFSEFINLDGNDKRKMLERIFGLEQYGDKLTKKYNEKLRATETQLKILSEKITVYEEYTEQNKKQIEKDLKEVEKNTKDLSKNLKLISEEKVKIDSEVKNATSLKTVKEELAKLEAFKGEIERDKVTLKSKEVFVKVSGLQSKIEEQGRRNSLLTKEKETLKENFNKLESSLKVVEGEIDSLNNSIKEDKKSLSEIKIDNNFLQDINNALQQESSLKVIESDINKNIKEVEDNKSLAEKLLIENKDIDLKIVDVSKKITDIKNEIETTKKDKEYWEKAIKVVQLNVNNKTRFEDITEKVYATFDEQISIIIDCEKNIKKCEEDILDFKLQNLAVTLAEKLVEGEPCPVCGSTVHPSVVKALEEGFREGKLEQIKALEVKKAESEKNIVEFTKGLEKRVVKFVERHNELEKETESLRVQLSSFEQLLVKNTQVVENYKNNNDKLENSRKELVIRLNEGQKYLEEIKVKYNLQKSFIEVSEEIKNTQSRIEKLQQVVESNEKTVEAKVTSRVENQNLLNEINIKIASNDTSLKEVLENLKTFENEMEAILTENNLDKDFINSFKNVDFDKLENKVQVYNEKVVIAQNKYEELKAFEVLNLEELLTTMKTVVDKQEEINRQIEENTTLKGVTSEKLNTFDIKIKEKSVVAEELKAVEKLYNDITSIKSLLQGKKFVEFIARKDLEEVVYFASEEFNRLSMGKYFLKLSEYSLDIEVVDNLQGGKCRGIKSLSGGETFIISLCLSLSLSKKIQMKKNSVIEFFFLDEGFGSLDNEALDNVTDSLMRLKSENINIGIITHVDKLKERVPKILYVENTANGTTVRI